jgi:hypothetical protein
MQDPIQNLVEYYILTYCKASYQLAATDFNQMGSPGPQESIIAR